MLQLDGVHLGCPDPSTCQPKYVYVNGGHHMSCVGWMECTLGSLPKLNLHKGACMKIWPHDAEVRGEGYVNVWEKIWGYGGRGRHKGGKGYKEGKKNR
jgi:hypothetical protein